MDVLASGLDWLSQRRQALTTPTVTYRRPSTGQSVEIKRILGQSQLVNVNPIGIDPDMRDVSQLSAETANRDYIVTASDLADIWPPQSGDLIDDENDIEGTTNRYQVMALPGQSPWRWFRGGRQRDARLYTKFFSTFASVWSDAFTGSDGDSIDAHSPDAPDGGAYEGDTGGMEIAANRLISSVATSYRYFDAGSANATAEVLLGYDVTLADLSGMYVESGVALRCASSGSGKRDGYYCTLRLVADDNAFTSQRLKIVQRTSGVSVEVAAVEVPYALDLGTVYSLRAEMTADRLTLSLLDSTGEVLVSSVAIDSPVMSGQTLAGLMFDHHASADPAWAWMDGLEVSE